MANSGHMCSGGPGELLQASTDFFRKRNHYSNGVVKATRKGENINEIYKEVNGERPQKRATRIFFIRN